MTFPLDPLPATPDNPRMRWKCVCAFDGREFRGWQSQADGSGVQDAVEKRLGEIFRRPVRVHGCSRTDTGVHARRYVFHFDAEWRHSKEALLAAFKSALPPSVLVFSARRAPESFHARFSSTGKRYVYYVYQGTPLPFESRYCVACPVRLDTESMAAAAAVLRGRNDFAAYSADGGDIKETTVRDLRRLEVIRTGRRIRFIAEADGFLYRMVRSLAGALIRTGEGKLSPGRVKELLDEKERTPEIPTAPPHGLFLDRVFYG